MEEISATIPTKTSARSIRSINGYMRPKVISNKAKKINCLNDIIIIVYRVFLQLIGFVIWQPFCI